MNRIYLKFGLFLALLLITIGSAVAFYIKENDKQKQTNDAPTADLLDDIANISPEQAYLSSQDSEGYGIGKRLYSDNKFVLTVKVNLPHLSQGESYEGWLSQKNDDGLEQFIYAGALSYMDDGYFLIYQSESDLRKYNRLIVSLEKTREDSPTQITLLGNFQ